MVVGFLSDEKQERKSKGSDVPYSQVCEPCLATAGPCGLTKMTSLSLDFLEYPEAPGCRHSAFHMLCCLHRRTTKKT